MPFLYVYSPSDFVSTPPDELGSNADGTAPFTLTLVAGATPTVIEISDDDAAFDEIDGTQQTLTSAVTVDGTSYAAGTFVSAAYDIINTTTGHMLTGFHFGGDGYQQGAIDGMASTTMLVPGQTYTFDTERTSHNQNTPYTDYVACFTKGTLVDTPDGPVPIEALREGDLINTYETGPQPLIWVGHRRVDAEGKFAPIRFEAGAIDNESSLEVSPEHRMLVRGGDVQLLFGENEVLMPAKALVNGRDVTQRSGGEVTYFHLLFEDHQVVFTHGALSESLLLSEASSAGFSCAASREALSILGEQVPKPMQASRLCLKKHESALIAALRAA
ncbi:Hint domain-containing protein [Lentibacter algarum]|uniref:Hint domain-containing protein n=1 Tax=Lentibacter algarum TaxID=576131 RepID=UPI001C076180|nr:Hint domain-containing protein [Lentibacter algarum]MBU2981927.1 Hint domain-containing protein [Lentibacter algarum]